MRILPRLKLRPITRRRLANFRANRRGRWSLWVFGLLLALSMPAEFIANDKPILIRLRGHAYWPVLFTYAETDFAGEEEADFLFETEPDYTDPLFMEDTIQGNGGRVVWPPIRWNFDTVDRKSEVPAPAPPSRQHWLGTDDQGRDVVARVIYGFRLSVLFGFTLTAISSAIGVLMGLWQGYAGGWVDLTMQRVMEIWGSVPQLYLLIIMASFIVPSFLSLLVLLLLFSWMGLVRVVRAETLRARNFDYVKAARALGLSNTRIALKHVLPNAMVAALTFLPFTLAGSLVTLTSLDFLGLGLPPGSPSLGELLQQGKANLHAPWLGITAFVVLSMMLVLVVFIGEAVRDAFDPRKLTGQA